MISKKKSVGNQLSIPLILKRTNIVLILQKHACVLYVKLNQYCFFLKSIFMLTKLQTWSPHHTVFQAIELCQAW